MIVALIHWRIKPDAASEKAFLEHWNERNRIAGGSGLIGEFLTQALPEGAFEHANWDIAGPGDHISYFTVGLWRDLESFKRAVSPYIEDEHDFEQPGRRRAVFEPVEWRVGEAALPDKNSPRAR